MPQILVSIIIPVYNCADYLQSTLDSVFAQTMPDFEVIVVNDNSTDATGELLSQYAGRKNVRILQNTCNMGVAFSRNQALEQAQGEFICFLDGDDLWKPDKLQKQLQFMQDQQCDLCYTAYDFMRDDGQPCGKTYRVPRQLTWSKLIYENVIGCSTVMCRAELLQKHRFREQYFHEDYVLWLELLKNGYCAYGVQEPLVKYRFARQSKSGNKIKAAKGRWEIYRSFLKMNRLQAFYAFVIYAAFGMKKRYISRA